MSIALALKYRPTQFSDLIGQDAISTTLSLALEEGRLSHAYLFSGLRGSGKTSSARIFARALQCQSAPTSTPCDNCDNCKSALEGRHIDIIELDAASNRGIDDIKSIIEQTKYRPSMGKYKIFIIDEVHMLTREAFNALLKTLEEPPEYVKFILATTDPLKLPATILSRTQHFRFKQIASNLITSHIANICQKEDIKADNAALSIIARCGNGSLRDTLTLLDQAILFCHKDINIKALTDMLGMVDPNVLDEFFTLILDSGDKDKIYSILDTLSQYEADNVIDEMMIFLKDRLQNKDKKYSITIIDRFFRILVDTKTLLSLNTNTGFALLLMMLKFQEALKIKDVESMIANLEKEISHIQPTSSQAPTTQNIAPTQSPTMPQTQSIPQSQSTPQRDCVLDPFTRLVQNIYDRNYALGEVFKLCVGLDSFADNKLNLVSKAQAEQRELIRENYNIIKDMIHQIYGQNVEINVRQANIHQEFLQQNQEMIKNIRDTVGVKQVIILENGEHIK